MQTCKKVFFLFLCWFLMVLLCFLCVFVLLFAKGPKRLFSCSFRGFYSFVPPKGLSLILLSSCSVFSLFSWCLPFQNSIPFLWFLSISPFLENILFCWFLLSFFFAFSFLNVCLFETFSKPTCSNLWLFLFVLLLFVFSCSMFLPFCFHVGFVLVCFSFVIILLLFCFLFCCQTMGNTVFPAIPFF